MSAPAITPAKSACLDLLQANDRQAANLIIAAIDFATLFIIEHNEEEDADRLIDVLYWLRRGAHVVRTFGNFPPEAPFGAAGGPYVDEAPGD